MGLLKYLGGYGLIFLGAFLFFFALFTLTTDLVVGIFWLIIAGILVGVGSYWKKKA